MSGSYDFEKPSTILAMNNGCFKPPPSLFVGRCHPLEHEVTKEVNEYFIKHWPFENLEAVRKFCDAGYPRAACYNYPDALDDRIHFACRLLTLLFLIDDLLEDMSFEAGSAYNEKLIPISRGDALPSPQDPVEHITYDLWNNMRACDHDLANDVLEPVFTVMRAQTDKTRVGIKDLGAYLEYRERDVGQALLSALMRFVMKLNLRTEESELIRDMDKNCSKHISVINDIFSWEKELMKSMVGHKEGSVLCSSVQVMAATVNISVDAAKRVLWMMCREWEACHEQMMASRQCISRDLIIYCSGLENLMSGNELWSKSTKRYHDLGTQAGGR